MGETNKIQLIVNHSDRQYAEISGDQIQPTLEPFKIRKIVKIWLTRGSSKEIEMIHKDTEKADEIQDNYVNFTSSLVTTVKGEPESEVFDTHNEMVDYLVENYSNHHLTTLYFTIPKTETELIPIAIFQCTACGKPIHHIQFNHSKACGSCDTGNIPQDSWNIEKPNHQKVSEQL